MYRLSIPTELSFGFQYEKGDSKGSPNGQANYRKNEDSRTRFYAGIAHYLY